MKKSKIRINVDSQRGRPDKDKEEEMVVDAFKATDVKEAVEVEEAAEVEEDTVKIRIAPTTPGTVLISNIFLGISSVPIGVLFKKEVENMLSVNTDMQSLVVNAVTMAHAGNVDMAEEDISKKLIMIDMTPTVEDVAAKDRVHIMALALEEERIDS